MTPTIANAICGMMLGFIVGYLLKAWRDEHD